MKRHAHLHIVFHLMRFMATAFVCFTVEISSAATNDDPTFWLFTATENRLNRTKTAIKHVTAEGMELTIGDENNGNNNNNAIDLDFSLPFRDKDGTAYVLTTIVNGCFNDNSHYTNLAFGAGLRYIGTNAFSFVGSTAYRKRPFTGAITFPSSLEVLGEAAFRSNNLSRVEFQPGSLEVIGNAAFEGCDHLVGELALPSNIVSVGDSAFRGTSLSEISFDGPMVLDIGDYATSDCTNLAHLAYPTSLRSIGASQLANCNSGLTVDWASFPSSFLSPDFLKGAADRISVHFIRRGDAAWAAYAEAFPGAFSLPSPDGTEDGWWAYGSATQTVRWASTSALPSSRPLSADGCGISVQRDERTGEERFLISMAGAAEGVRYSVFTSPTLTNAFWEAAEANRSVEGGAEALEFLLAMDMKRSAMFARVVASAEGIPDGALLACTPGAAPALVSAECSNAAEIVCEQAASLAHDFAEALHNATSGVDFDTVVAHPASLASIINIRLQTGATDVAEALSQTDALRAKAVVSSGDLQDVAMAVEAALTKAGYVPEEETELSDGVRILFFKAPQMGWRSSVRLVVQEN